MKESFQKIAVCVGMIALTFFAFKYDSVLCGIGAFLCFIELLD